MRTCGAAVLFIPAQRRRSRRVLEEYIDNELQPADASDLRAHLALCTECRTLLTDREALCRLLRHLPYYPASDRLRVKVARMRTRPRFNRGLLTWAVSDLADAELGEFVGALQR
jgi:anti-sigma factor RsiW